MIPELLAVVSAAVASLSPNSLIEKDLQPSIYYEGGPKDALIKDVRESFKTEGDELLPNVASLSSSSSIYTDNGYSDDFPSGATEIDSTSGKITGTLVSYTDDELKDRPGLSSYDKDYFKFTTTELMEYKFEIKGPESYRFRISRYYKDLYCICESSRTFSFNLEPATYYLCVYPGSDKQIFPDLKYEVNYSRRRTTNNSGFPLTSDFTSTYKAVLWENEIWPFNAQRRGTDKTLLWMKKHTRGSTSDIYQGWVDPLYTPAQTKDKAREYLESVLYVWDRAALEDFQNKFNGILEALEERIKSSTATEIKANWLNDGINITLDFLQTVPVLGDAISLASFVWNIGEFTSLTLQMISSVFPNGASLGGKDDFALDVSYYSKISGCLEGALKTNGADSKFLFGLPRFYKVYSKNSRNGMHWRKTEIYAEEYWRSVSYSMGSEANVVTKTSYLPTMVHHPITGERSYGKLTPFKTGADFERHLKTEETIISKSQGY